MDHDAVDKRLRKVERLLDAVQPGWRDERNWPKWERRDEREQSLNEDAAASDLVVDEEQTKADRVALGYDTDPGDPNAPGNAPKEPASQPETYVDSEGREWRKVAENDWATGGEPDSPDFQEFSGSLDELKTITKKD